MSPLPTLQSEPAAPDALESNLSTHLWSSSFLKADLTAADAFRIFLLAPIGIPGTKLQFGGDCLDLACKLKLVGSSKRVCFETGYAINPCFAW